MKVNIIGKYKWYIMGLIAAVLILSIGLSFCIWDTTSIAKIGDMSGGVANYSDLPVWTNKSVGGDFTDASGMKWLVVDKTTADGKTNMVLMTYYVTEQMVYEPTNTNPDYNSPKNNIREYLNKTWHPSLDAEIKKYTVPRLIKYQDGTVFVKHPDVLSPDVIPVAPTNCVAWIPGELEIGMKVTNHHGTPNLTHDKKFGYFPEQIINGNVTDNAGANSIRVAYTKTGTAVNWWTRTGRFSHHVTVVTPGGGMSITVLNHVRSKNWMRPCVEVQFDA